MKNPKQPNTFCFEDKDLPANEQSSVLEVLLSQKVDIDHSCGGFATCGTCQVIVEKDVDFLPDRNEVEAQFAKERGFEPHERLACQLSCKAGLTLSRPYFFKTKKGLE